MSRSQSVDCRDHFQPVAGSLALGPKLIAGAAEKGDIPGPQCLFKGFPIHEAQHQHFAAARILHDGGQQPLHFVEINFLVHRVSKVVR